ncbi:hypothetical protein I4U23_028005 [Adineta vaga]|nr:hypothetical protein I4U23_028005 [Adineta vaga]
MKPIILVLILSVNSCFAEQLLGGWTTSTDESLKQECLQKALTKIHGVKVGDDVQTLVSDHVCKTQVVNGLNIKCTFVLRKENWECSFYKSFIEQLDMQVEECKQVEKTDEQVIEKATASNEDLISNQDGEDAPTARARDDAGEVEEEKIDAINEQNSNDK